jgi:hypothetical protein
MWNRANPTTKTANQQLQRTGGLDALPLLTASLPPVAELDRSTGTIPYSQTHLCIPKQLVPTRIWADLGGAHLRAPVLSTDARWPRSATCSGPTHRRMISNATAAGGLPSGAAPTTSAPASGPGGPCVRLGRRQEDGQ